MEMLFSPHFSKSPECCTCQTYSPFDILLTPSILRYQSSQIDKSRDLFQHPFPIALAVPHVVFLLPSFLFFLHLSLVPFSCCSYPLCSSDHAGSPSSLPSGQCHRQNGGCLVVCQSFTPVPLPSFSANLITISSIRLNKSGDSPHLCLTPTLILNRSVNSPSIRTALMDLLYRSSINVTSSSGTPQYLITLHNPSCHTLSNACL